MNDSGWQILSDPSLVYSTPVRTSISPSTRPCPSAKLLTNAELEECFSTTKKSSHSHRQRRQQWIELPMETSTDRQVPYRSYRMPTVHQWKNICEPSCFERDRRYPKLEFDQSLLSSSMKNSEEKHSFIISENILREKFHELLHGKPLN